MRVAVDTSTWVAYLNGDAGDDTTVLDEVLESGRAVMPPVVLSELLSDPCLPKAVDKLVCGVPRLEIKEGYWVRAGKLRAQILGKKRKARLADTLIATSCLDHRVPLLTRDADFKHFARHAKLKLLL